MLYSSSSFKNWAEREGAKYSRQDRILQKSTCLEDRRDKDIAIQAKSAYPASYVHLPSSFCPLT